MGVARSQVPQREAAFEPRPRLARRMSRRFTRSRTRASARISKTRPCLQRRPAHLPPDEEVDRANHVLASRSPRRVPSARSCGRRRSHSLVASQCDESNRCCASSIPARGVALDSRRCLCTSSPVCACGTFAQPGRGTSSCSASPASFRTPRRRCGRSPSIGRSMSSSTPLGRARRSRRSLSTIWMPRLQRSLNGAGTG
jgi:hypothetical protein